MIEDYREEMDRIDEKLLELFVERMNIVREIGEIKRKNGLLVFDSEREKQIYEDIRRAAPEDLEGYAVSFFYNLLVMSRNMQRDVIGASNRFTDRIKEIIEKGISPKKCPKVAVQGIAGSFSAEAARKMYRDCEISFVESWEDIFCMLAEGEADYGVLPVENSMSGAIVEIFDLLFKYKYPIVKALSLPVRHCLLGVRGAKLSDIREVYSQMQALAQCAQFLSEHRRINPVPCSNTALAARKVALEGNEKKAAIASAECAHVYGLDILYQNVQQNDTNRTRFVSVSRDPEIPIDANKISVAFTLPHVTGALYRTLGRFALNGLNLTRLEARPLPGTNFENFFFLDFMGSVRSPGTLSVLSALSEELAGFCFLGSYNEMQA